MVARAEPDREPDYRFPVRVYYEDTDAAGIVYYANYLKFAERARSEMLREGGAEAGEWLDQHGLTFVVRRCLAEYHRPARLDDLVEVRSWIMQLRAASFVMRQDVCRGKTLLVSMEIQLAGIDHEMKPARLPQALIAALTPQYGAGT